MRKTALGLALALPLAWLLPAATPTSAATSRPCPTSSPAAAGRLQDVVLESTALRGPTRVCILLPVGYATSHERYPVLYLLHGAGDDQSTWMANTDVEELTKDLDLIVVMPDGGKAPDAGWYTDWLQGPAWESYHIGELIPWVDKSLRTVATREGRAVAGLSMGGFGAMSYAARHPDLFAAAASFSGAVDTADGGPLEGVGFKLAHDQFGTPDERVWGPYTDDEVIWRDHNPPDLASNLRWTTLSLSTGTGVPQPGDNPPDAPTEAAIHVLNLAFHNALTSAAIPHQWRETTFGTHSWPYWQDDLHQVLPLVLDAFAHPPAQPGAFDYRTADPTFSVWGWSFASDRLAREFVDLYVASKAGLVARAAECSTS